MKDLNLPNAALIALVACCFIQIGAQLFAVSIIASTVSSAPPRSFAMFTGEYAYDSRAFWDVVPMITFLLFVIALIANWKTTRRYLIFAALLLFVVAGLGSALYLEPTFNAMMETGYRDSIDPVMQAQARSWYRADWMVWGVSLTAGLVLLLAILKPVTNRS